MSEGSIVEPQAVMQGVDLSEAILFHGSSRPSAEIRLDSSKCSKCSEPARDSMNIEEKMEDVVRIHACPQLRERFEPMPDYYTRPYPSRKKEEMWNYLSHEESKESKGSILSLEDTRVQLPAPIQTVQESKPIEKNEVPMEQIDEGEENIEAEEGSIISEPNHGRIPALLSRNPGNKWKHLTETPEKPEEKVSTITLSIGMFNSVTSGVSVLKDYHSSFNGGAQRSRLRSFNEEESHPKPLKCCTCKKSRCLKLYCECFASGQYCEGCNCVDCYNKESSEAERAEAVRSLKYRNPAALMRKAAINEQECGERHQSPPAQFRCHCSKSGCQKGYCECFKKGLKCSSLCTCTNCKNSPGLTTLTFPDPCHHMPSIRQSPTQSLRAQYFQ